MNRRGFLTGLLAAPVVITTPGLLMPVKPVLDTSYILTVTGVYESPGWVMVHHDEGMTITQTAPGVWQVGDQIRLVR